MKTLDVVLRTHKPLTANEIADLAGMGLRIVAALGTQVYRVRGTSDASLADLQALSYVADASEFAPMEKLDEALKQQVQQVTAATAAVVAGAEAVPAPTVSVLVSLDRYADTSATLEALAQIGEVEESSKRRALVKVSAAKIDAIAELPGVLAAEVEPVSQMQNDMARDLTLADPIADNLGLDGSGEIVGVADSGLDTGVNDAGLLADFAGRVVNIRATVDKAAFGVADGADLQNHGTHVCGSILSDGANSNGNLAGMAPAAQLTMLSMGPDNSLGLVVPIDLITGVLQDAYDDGARLHNNSWGSHTPGTPYTGPYTAHSVDVDEFVRDNPDMLIIIAAGNAGRNGAHSVLAPGTAKNCLTVGACESVRPLPAPVTINPNLQDHDFNPATPDVNVPLWLPDVDEQADDVEDIAVFSGRGPTSDDRIKPDIVAPGTWILSCRSSVSTADLGPDGLPHAALENPPGSGNFPYADDADGVATHAEAVGRGLPGAPFYGTWNQNTPACPPGSGAACQQNYYYNSGTSMAAPITTGAAALLRQYLRERRGIANPPAALIKALLINGATVPAGESNAPNNDRGFGWLNLENTLTPAPTGQQAYSDDVDLAIGPPAPDGTRQMRSFSVQLADVGHPFRVTLTWTDAPGPANVGGLVNQLYLRVIDPDGTVFDGDVSAFPVVSNNVQRVHIDTPVAGVYTIEVHGIDVTSPIDAHLPDIRQDFALAVINGIGFSPEPVDICQVIDKSGSMGYYGYMDPVKERAKQLVDMLRINDRTGVVAFDGTAVTANPVVPIDGLPTQAAIKVNIDALTSSGVTSIGAGLERGQAEIASGGDPGHPQAMVLLSDGHENTPPWVGGGVTDSPPAWYGGPNFTEILPTIPASTKIYTVSLGVQSDEVLLQDIASATGGVFHAIHSPAEIGDLHEIYVHLQALTGGEEVIASGSDSVDGLYLAGSGAGTGAGVAGADTDVIDGALRADLEGLVNVSAMFPDPGSLRRLFTTRVHDIPVDESFHSVVMMVSWHDLGAPVSLTLISPSHHTIPAGSPLHFDYTGSSYQFFRIEDPEPGTWRMLVRSGKRESGPARSSHAYTWGAYGPSSLGIRYRMPKKILGQAALRITAGLAGRKVARTIRFAGSVNLPRLLVKSLLERHRSALADVKLPFKPDNPQLNPDLFKLAVLDKRLRDEGERPVFGTLFRRLDLTRNNRYTDAIKTPIPGLHTVQLAVTGRSRRGFTYRRQTRFSVRI